MDNVFMKTRELGEALLECDTYKAMKEAEDKAMQNMEAAELMSKMLEMRTTITEKMQKPNPDPAELKRLSDEMDDIQEKLQMIDDIVALTESRSAFNSLINQINQVLQFIVTGRMDSDDNCAGDCSSCGGCH